MEEQTDQNRRSAEEAPSLIRSLSLFDITMVGVGAMIGAGIFVLTGIAAGTAGPALILAFALNGVVTILTAMVYAELGSAIPEAGGGYLWVKEGLPDWNAFLAGWMSWFAHAVAGSLYALGFGSYLELVLRNFHLSLFGLSGPPLQKSLAVVIAVLFVAINFKGVSETGKVGNIVTMGKIVILLIFIGSGFVTIFANPVNLEKFTPFAPHGIGGVVIAMGLTFIAFEGYEIIVQAGEEVKNPRVNIPKAIFLSLAIVIPIYLLVAFTAIGAVNPGSAEPTWQWLSKHAELGLAEAARQFMPLGTTFLLVGGVLSTMSALNATTFSSTRVSFAMGRDRNLPDLFSKIHEKTRTPFLALLFSGILITFMAVAIPIEDVAAAADVMFLLLFLQVNIAVITIRRNYGDKLNYGFLMPLFPVLPVINIGLILFLAVFMFHFSALAWFFVIGWIVAGFVIYWTYASHREREKGLTPILVEERRSFMLQERFRVLVPIANPKTAETILQVAARVARPKEGELLLLHVITVAPQTPPTAGGRLLRSTRSVMDQAAAICERLQIDHHTMVRMGHKPAKGIIDTVEEREVDFVVMGWRGRSRDHRTVIGRNIDDVLKGTPCNVLAIQQGTPIPAKRILIPVANPNFASLMLSLGRLILDDDPRARIDVIHVVPRALDVKEKESRVEEIRAALQKPTFFDPEETEVSLEGGPISFEVIEAASVWQTILNRTKNADVLIMGSALEGWLGRRISGGRPNVIARRSTCPIIVVNQQTSPVKFEIQTFFQFFRERPEVKSGP